MPETPEASVPGDVDFVGVDDDSPANKCPAVLVIPGTGDILQVGRQVTDPATLTQLARHTSIADDEVAIWTRRT
jgi:hypothetical protein